MGGFAPLDLTKIYTCRGPIYRALYSLDPVPIRLRILHSVDEVVAHCPVLIRPRTDQIVLLQQESQEEEMQLPVMDFAKGEQDVAQ